jgi:hypothetical protein
MSRSMIVAAMCAVLQAPASAAELPHVSGGIGIAEQEAMKAREAEFSLKLVFTLVEGNYIAGVGVQIKDAAGDTLLEHIAAGPMFMARLAPGRYSVSVTYEGRSISRRVEVGRTGLRTEYFRWPSNPLTDVPLPAESPERGEPAGKSKRR